MRARTGTPARASAAAIRRLSLPPVRLSSTGAGASRSGVTACTSAAATRAAASGPLTPGSVSGPRSVSVSSPPAARQEVAGPSARTPVKGVTAPSGYPGPSSPAYSRASASAKRPVTAAAHVARSERTVARPARATNTGSTRVTPVRACTIPRESSGPPDFSGPPGSSETQIVPA